MCHFGDIGQEKINFKESHTSCKKTSKFTIQSNRAHTWEQIQQGKPVLRKSWLVDIQHNIKLPIRGCLDFLDDWSVAHYLSTGSPLRSRHHFIIACKNSLSDWETGVLPTTQIFHQLTLKRAHLPHGDDPTSAGGITLQGGGARGKGRQVAKKKKKSSARKCVSRGFCNGLLSGNLGAFNFEQPRPQKRRSETGWLLRRQKYQQCDDATRLSR